MTFDQWVDYAAARYLRLESTTNKRIGKVLWDALPVTIASQLISSPYDVYFTKDYEKGKLRRFVNRVEELWGHRQLYPQ